MVLHSGLAGDMRLWREAGYLDGLGGMSVVTIDPRGHGLSDRPHGLAAHRIEHYVDDVLHVLDAQQIERCAFLGHGDGACVGVELALRHPDELAAGDHRGDRRARRAPRGGSGAARGGLVPVVRSWRGRRTGASQLAVDPTDRVRSRHGVLPARGVVGLARRVVAAARCAGADAGVVGEYEDPRGDAARAAATMPRGAAATVPDTGHLGVLLQTDAVLRRAAPFISEAAR